MSPLRELQNWLHGSALSGIIIPSTDEFLSEFAPPDTRRLRWVTGFRGSTGVAIVLRDSAVLFLDARYLLQGPIDTASEAIAVEPASPDARHLWLRQALSSNTSIGIDPRLHSMPDLAQWRELAAALPFDLRLLDENPIDQLWKEQRPPRYAPPIVDYPEHYAGQSYRVKYTALFKHLEDSGLESLLIADPEDVSWLLNVRAAEETMKTSVGDWPVVPACRSRVLAERSGRLVWFMDRTQLDSEVLARADDTVTFAPPDELAGALSSAALKGPIGADPRSTSAALMALMESCRKVTHDDWLARQRWCKHAHELTGAKQAHVLDAVAVVRFMAWLVRTVSRRPISEFEAAEQLEHFRSATSSYKGASMPLMSASGESGAQPHYVPRREHSRRLNDHPIYWMDSGGHYPGGTTDNTLALALGQPEPRHVLVHTLILQAFIALATARVPVGACGMHLDTIARKKLWEGGIDCSHGIGHGVGNNLNIHEGPGLSHRVMAVTTVPIEAGMIITNEPGHYVAGDFGLRIESHMTVVASNVPGFLEFETISRLPIDARLVDFDRLSDAEIKWLAQYHRCVLQDLSPHLDEVDRAWLSAKVAEFTRQRQHEH